jgi:hypothetical protein
MPGSPEGAVPSPENGSNWLLSPEEQQAAMAERQASEQAAIESARVAAETGQPIPDEREPVTVDPNDLSDAAKIKAARRTGVPEEQIGDYLSRPDGTDTPEQ